MFGGMGISDNEVQFYAVSKDGYAVEGMGDTILVADEANVVTEDDGDMIHLHGAEGDDIIFGNDNETEGYVDHIMGGDGNDYIRAYGGDNMVFGGGGDDIFVVDYVGYTVIYGDDSSGNSSYGDTVLLNFDFNPENVTIKGDVYTITQDVGDGDTASIELHDVEKLVFFDSEGNMTTKMLTDGSVESISANYDEVSFRFDGDTISVVQEYESGSLQSQNRLYTRTALSPPKHRRRAIRRLLFQKKDIWIVG